MSIAFGTSAVGSTTGATSFTIALSSSAGAQIIVVVALPSSTTSVTSITDGGGNTYSRKAAANNSTTLRIEIWASNKPASAASGTITVNVSPSSVAAGVAASYTGVTIVSIPGASSTGSTSPITSGSTTLQKTNAWLITGGSLAAANTFTASSGSLRNQTTSTSLAAVLIDSNGAASPVTDSATMTAASWVQFSLQMYTGLTVPLNYSDVTEADDAVSFMMDKTGTRYSRVEPLAFTQLKRLVPVEATQTIIYQPPKKIELKYAQPDLAYTIPTKLSKPPSKDSFKSDGFGDKKDHFAAFSGQLNPTRVLTPLGFLTYEANRKVILNNAPSDDLKPPFVPTVIPPRISAWLSTDSNRSAYQLNYAPTDFVNQIYPTLQLTSLGYLPYDANRIVPQGFSRGDDFTKPTFVPTIVSVEGWFGTDGLRAIPSIFKVGDDFTKPVFPPTIVVTPTIAGWFGTDGQKSQPQSYAPSDFINQIGTTLFQKPISNSSYMSAGGYGSPSHYNAFIKPIAPQVAAAVSYLAAWLGQDGQKAVQNIYAQPDFVNQIFPTLALTSLAFDLSRIVHIFRQVGYSQSAEDVNPGAPILQTVAGWESFDGVRSLLSTYAPSDFVKPTATQIAQIIDSWIPYDSQRAIQNTYAPSDFVKPIFIPTVSIGGWLGTDGAKAVIRTYSQSDFVSQIFPTRVLTPLGYLPYDANRIVPSRYSQIDFAKPTFVPSVIPSIGGWTGTDGVRALPQFFAKTDYVNQIYPTLALLPRLLSDIAFLPPNAQPQRFAIPSWEAPPKLGMATVAAPTIAGWLPTEGLKSVQLNYAQPDFVNQLRPTLSLLPRLPLIDVAPWLKSVYDPFDSPYWRTNQTNVVNPVAPAVAQYLAAFYSEQNLRTVSLQYTQSFDSPLHGGLEPVFYPPFAGWNPDVQWQAVTPVHNQSYWDAPPKFGLTTAAAITIAGWSPTIGANSVILNYAKSDFVSQLRPTLSLLARLSQLAEPGANALPQQFAISVWDAPPKLGMATVATPTIAGWLSTEGLKAVLLKYAQPDFVNQLRPTLALLPLITSEWTKPAANAVILNYAPSAWDAPPKLGLATVATPTIAGWLSTEGLKAVLLNYAKPDFVNQIRQTLATLPLFSSELTKPAANAVVLNYAPTAWDAPPKLNMPFVALPTIASWSPTEGLHSVILKYAQPEFINQLRPTLSQLPLITSEWTKPGNPAVVLKYAAPAWDAPPKFGLAFIAVSYIATFAPVPWPTVILPYAQAFDAPMHGALGPVFYPTFSGWTPDNVQNAIPSPYSRVFPYSAPEKVIVYVPPPPVLSAWTPTIGNPIVLLKYAQSIIFTGPEKVIPYIPALPTLESWTPTIGPNAQPEKFAISDFAAPGKFIFIVPPKAVIARGIIFYKVVTQEMQTHTEINKGMYVYKVYAVTANMKQKLVRNIYVDKNSGRVIYIENITE